jgi:type II secretory pathway component PulJ
MKTPWKKLFVAGSLAAFGLTAMAQMDTSLGGHGGMHGMHHGKTMNPERMQARAAKHLAELKRKLNINPSQEPAWTAFTTAMKPPSAPPVAMPGRAELDKLTTPERIDKMRQLRAEHHEAMKPLMDKRDDAIKTFYAALDDAQKKTFDAEHAHKGRRGPM